MIAEPERSVEWYRGYALEQLALADRAYAAGRGLGIQRDRARDIAMALEQENAELLRLLTDLVTEASDLDAWPSSGRTRALDEAKDYLARTAVPR